MIPSFGQITQTLPSKSNKNRKFAERYYPSLENISMVPDDLYIRPLSRFSCLRDRITDSLEFERKRYGGCIEISIDVDSEGPFVKVLPIRPLIYESVIRKYGAKR